MLFEFVAFARGVNRRARSLALARHAPYTQTPRNECRTARPGRRRAPPSVLAGGGRPKSWARRAGGRSSDAQLPSGPRVIVFRALVQARSVMDVVGAAHAPPQLRLCFLKF